MSRFRLTGVAIASLAVASLAVALPAAMLPASATAVVTRASTACARPAPMATIARVGRVAIAAARRQTRACPVGAAKLSSSEPPYLTGSAAPLRYHAGGPVMGTSSTASIVVTPVFWLPTGTTYAFDAGYTNLIETYLTDVASDSGKRTNVFSTLTQYSGSNGTTHYRITAGAPITDTTALPSAACTFDSGPIYNDATGYSACVDDLQAQAEVAHVVSAQSLPTDLNHIYALFLPKGVESCFYPDTVPIGQSQACSINSSASSAYCAYHSAFGAGNNSIYATMPFPIYQSATLSTCSTDQNGSTPQTPNNNIAGDTVVSTLSHEVSEAISDPQINAWYASDGNENGDLCAYIYGNVLGTAGHKYNQTINGHHYLTQEEFSNKEYVPSVAGCEQDQQTPTLTSLSRVSGSHRGGGLPITIHGTSFRAGTTKVRFGTTNAASVIVTSPTTLTAVAPAHPAGVVNVRVITPNGTSPLSSHDKYTYT